MLGGKAVAGNYDV